MTRLDRAAGTGARAVCQGGGNPEPVLRADLHERNALCPSFDHAPKIERARFVLPGFVELRAVEQRAAVVADDRILSGRARGIGVLGGLKHFVLQAAFGHLHALGRAVFFEKRIPFGFVYRGLPGVQFLLLLVQLLLALAEAGLQLLDFRVDLLLRRERLLSFHDRAECRNEVGQVDLQVVVHDLAAELRAECIAAIFRLQHVGKPFFETLEVDRSVLRSVLLPAGVKRAERLAPIRAGLLRRNLGLGSRRRCLRRGGGRGILGGNEGGRPQKDGAPESCLGHWSRVTGVDKAEC